MLQYDPGSPTAVHHRYNDTAGKKCSHNRCFNVGPFGSRWYVGRQEWVAYKLCSECRARNALGYDKAKDSIIENRKKPENRKRQNKLRSTEIMKQHRKHQRDAWEATDHGRGIILFHQDKRKAEINQATCLRIEQTLTASIRGRLKGLRHGESANLSAYSEFVDHDDIVAHFESELKPGMTIENYGTVWSIAHKIPKCYYDFSDPEEIKRCNSKANLGCDYEVWPNPLNERVNSSKGGAMPSLSDLQSIDVCFWPALFGTTMDEEKRNLLRKHRSVL